MGNGKPIVPEEQQRVKPPNPPVEVLCEACKKKWMFQPPEPQVINVKTFSMAVWVHEQTARCPHCFQTFAFVVGNVSTGWGLIPVRETQEDRKQIIVPPPGLKLV